MPSKCPAKTVKPTRHIVFAVPATVSATVQRQPRIFRAGFRALFEKWSSASRHGRSTGRPAVRGFAGNSQRQSGACRLGDFLRQSIFDT